MEATQKKWLLTYILPAEVPLVIIMLDPLGILLPLWAIRNS